ncbi:hypothetical protein HMI54_006821 [Coelomomyces lativittatus]|nr:hypothetical protein HMI54_006821 [Coelomomyces lativittatus]KAJ1506064.1 hypothetical protein HMI56_000785 [Coelomomyces lativittatus]KAJ1512055.1 hypothetical protein HMI55_006368 [Coelomomyces lativittatus]
MLRLPGHIGIEQNISTEKASSLPSSLLNVDDSFKLLIVGGQKSGKTCLIHRLLNNNFNFNALYDKTLGASLSIHFTAQGDHRVSLALWEIGGDINYRNTLIQYFSDDTASILLLIHVHQQKSKDEALEIYELLKKHCPTSTLWIIGSQAEDLNQTKASEFIKWAQDTFETTNVKTTSAKTGEGVSGLFQDIRSKLLEPFM